MKRRYLIIVTVVIIVLAGFWPRISKTATGIAQKTIQIVSSTGTVLGTGGANAGPAPAEVVNVVDSTNHIVDSFGATQPFACATNNASCVTQANSTGTQLTLLQVDNSNNLTVGGAGLNSTNVSAGNSGDRFVISAFTAVIMSGNSVSINGGWNLQSTGGAVPTCSAATGTCVTVAGSTNNRGQIHLTGGTAVTSITLTFSAAGTWGQAPFCTVGSGTAAVAGLASPTGACASTAACIFAVSSTTAADINYTCI